MLRITCYFKDCPTPHFIVDPKGGRIPLIGGADDGKITFSMDTVQRMKTVIQKAESDSGTDGFTDEDKEILKEWCKAIQPESTTSGKTEIEEVKSKPGEEAYNDYMVVYCETNHRNYIPFHNPKKKTTNSN